MANIPLKTLKFPGLNDTYVIPEISINDPNNDGNVELLFTIPASLITFYLESVDGYGEYAAGTYHAPAGMTMIDWVQSEYNTSEGEIWYSESSGDINPYIYYESSLYTMMYFQVIEDGHTYYTY